MKNCCAVLLLLTGSVAVPAAASDLEGPARFCGYSPIIDLLPGERITTLDGGIHAGNFRWQGAFGTLVVRGIGWASRPNGDMVVEPTEDQPGRFEQDRRRGKFTIAIWNGRQGAAIFESPTRFTRRQIQAIERVRLFQEGEEPVGCNLRTVFVWQSGE